MAHSARNLFLDSRGLNPLNQILAAVVIPLDVTLSESLKALPIHPKRVVRIVWAEHVGRFVQLPRSEVRALERYQRRVALRAIIGRRPRTLEDRGLLVPLVTNV